MVPSLPSKKRGRPLLLGDELDKQVQSYVRATRDGKELLLPLLFWQPVRQLYGITVKAFPMKMEGRLNLLDTGPDLCLNGWILSREKPPLQPK